MDDVLRQAINNCISNHPLCNEFYSFFHSNLADPTVPIIYTGNNRLITTILGSSLPSPDGLEWDEFHHIGGRAHSDVGRLISRQLHNRIHAGHSPEIEPPRVKFHCLEPGREWAGAYLAGSFIPKPSRPIQISWDIRLQDLKHRTNGSEASSAQLSIEEFVTQSIREYIYYIRTQSWDEFGIRMKYNVSPSELPASHISWAEDVKNQVKTWYILGPAQKQHLNHLASVYGHLGTKLFSNGFSFDEIQGLMSTHRMAHAIYRISTLIYRSSEDSEILVDKLKNDLDETSSLSDDQRAKELISRWVEVTEEAPTSSPINITRKVFYNNQNIFMISALPFSDSELRRIGEISEPQQIEFDILQLIDDNI
jgi:hypothetical protein